MKVSERGFRVTHSELAEERFPSITVKKLLSSEKSTMVTRWASMPLEKLGSGG